jgi:hypothetical protein
VPVPDYSDGKKSTTRFRFRHWLLRNLLSVSHINCCVFFPIIFIALVIRYNYSLFDLRLATKRIRSAWVELRCQIYYFDPTPFAVYILTSVMYAASISNINAIYKKHTLIICHKRIVDTLGAPSISLINIPFCPNVFPPAKAWSDMKHFLCVLQLRRVLITCAFSIRQEEDNN